MLRVARSAWASGVLMALVSFCAPANGAEISGDYLESRTCDIYTGPCFANGEMGLVGKNALMAWSIDQGTFDGVDLAGLKVVAAVRAAETLKNIDVRRPGLKTAIIVDSDANPRQQQALVAFVRSRLESKEGEVVRVEAAPIELELDHIDMVAKLTAGKSAKLVTREVRDGDCVCTNEIVYYPPLTNVDNFAPAVVVDGGFRGRGLGTRWTTPGARSAFLATFAY